ncbi:BP74-related protein [Nocardia aurantiaca]|uniref:BP74-related protein n=1 Tax=Nocardia aurantiaca TaxID=2675850 RepID=UPI001E556F5C|nr:calmodulin [Nocardia aurantiaca]
MAYFAFTDYSGKEFVFKVDNEQRIDEARRILSGEETMSVHVMGRIRKQPVQYNPGWNFHLDPDTITFFTMAIEVCDSSIAYTEDHLDEVCGAFLPGCFWCPWSSKLTREISEREAVRA